eukprot:XP_002939598.2 PREDICTED: tripartite motif-containing protein 7-like [Xenopus tropicalis]
MASAELSNNLTCSVCKEIYRKPVTLPCGHSFCKPCIEKTWNVQEDYLMADPCCPECRQPFRRKPELNRNIALHKIAEQILPENTKCSAHNKHLKYHCSDDGALICESCCHVGDHQGHKVESLNEAFEKHKAKLREVLKKLTPEKEKTEGQVQRLQKNRKEVEEILAGETERVTTLFKDIREMTEALEKKSLDEISELLKRRSLPFTDLIQQLETKKSELSMKIHNINNLCNMPDPLTFLQRSDGAAFNYEGRERDDVEVPAVGDLDMDLIPDTLIAGLAKIVTVLEGWRMYGKKATNMLMDINTIGNNVSVSGDGKCFSYSDQQYPQKPERFHISQGLSTMCFSSGRHYWEVEGSELGHWKVGVAYPSIKRNGDQSFIGDNNKSWCLCRWQHIYSVTHNNEWTHLSLVPSCGRIRIFLDYEAGCLSFYELSESIRHLHTFTATFTESLHAAFWVWGNTWVRIIS